MKSSSINTPRLRLFFGMAAAALLVVVLFWWVVSGSFAEQFRAITGNSAARIIRPDQTPGCGLAWRVVDSPNPSKEYSELHAISADSATDVWAIGTTGTEEYALTFIVRWDGHAWTRVESPSVPDYSNHLLAVAALAPDDVWTVGASHRGTDLWRTLTMHWDGQAWKIVPSPTLEPISSLNAVAAVAPNDIWAIGEHSSGTKGSGSQPLMLHWDGQAWKIVPAPGDANSGVLNGAVAFSSNDVWAVGSITEGVEGRPMALVMHWDGKQWRKVPALAPGELWSISGKSSGDMWAVGYNGPATLAMHWTGSNWQYIQTPNPGSRTNILDGVVVRSPNDVWAVGAMSDDQGDATLAMHWDGSKWSAAPGILVGTNVATLSGVALAGSEVWAAGSYITGDLGTNLTVTERYSDPCGSDR